MTAKRLIVFARSPEPGKTKTRLIPALGPEGAARLHEEMIRTTLGECRAACKAMAAQLEVRTTGCEPSAFAVRFGGELHCTDQGGGDLGERLHRAITAAAEQGATRIVVIGTDCPTLTSDLIESAFSGLIDSDVVLGPALDGGYYLIGLKAPCQSLFTDIAWSTAEVFEATKCAASAAGFTVKVLVTLRDVDTPADL